MGSSPVSKTFSSLQFRSANFYFSNIRVFYINSVSDGGNYEVHYMHIKRISTLGILKAIENLPAN